MRDTIDFGIDLGTTNSAIAVARDGVVSVVKNNENWDYTPSAVWIPKAGVAHVGRRARDRVGVDVDNAHSEFKQEMGLDGAVRMFRNAGLPLTPQQLSAEVLKSLRADAAHVHGEAPQAAVITVPAAFALHQNNATSEAAVLAGLTTCKLVQEPTAAAFAFGFQNEGADACWMVFDFGGGTFDSAVVSTHDGELRVLDHAGDPHLGGKLIDWAIVERLLAPAAEAALGLTDLRRENPVWRRNFAVLKNAAEEAKIALSRSEAAEVLVDLDVDGGGTETFEYTMHRGDADRVAEPYYLRAINLCRDALAKAGLGAADVDRLLLVGGTTLAPGLRERLADPSVGLGIELDHSQDPSTVVARGAAVFASTVPLDRPKTRPVAGEFSVDLRYPRSTSLTSVPVQGRFESTTPQDWTRFHVVLDNPHGKPPFRTPQISLDAQGVFVTDVRVDERVTSTFDVLLVEDGVRRTVNPATASITHVLNELGGQTLTNSLGLSEADGTFTRILHKNARLPAAASGTFYTTIALVRTDTNAVIRIPIVEGERDRASRNLLVGVIEIRPKDVRLDLPAGTEVEITIEVDESRLVTVVADVPLVDEQFDAVLDLSNVQAPDPVELERELRAVHGRLATLRDNRRASAAARAKLDRLESEKALETAGNEVRRASVDKGHAAGADGRLRDIQAVLDEVEAEYDLSALLDDLTEAIGHCRELLDRKGAADDLLELADIERRAADVRRNPDRAVVEELIGRAVHLSTMVLKRDESYDIGVFEYFRENLPRLSQPMRARALIAEGNQAIQEQNWRVLPSVNQELRKLWPVGTPERSQGGVRSLNGRA